MLKAHARAFAHGLICIYIVAACSRKPVHRPGEEWLKSIRFEGNKSIDDKDLRSGLALERVSQHGVPDPYLIKNDGERIRGEYIRRGFFAVEVRSRLEHHGEATTVTYTIAEGPRATTRVMITGLPPNDPDVAYEKVRAALPLQDGEPFSYAPYDQAKEHLLALFENAGYAHAELDAHVIADLANHVAIVHLAYDPGPKCRFGSVDIIGVSEELKRAVRARLAFEPGEQYSATALTATQRRLYELKRFSSVTVAPSKTAGDVIDVRVTLAHSARNELSVGGGLGMDPASYELRVRTGYAIVGWPTPLTDLTLDLRPAYAMLRDTPGYEPRIIALAKLTRIDLFRPFVIGDVEAGYNYLNYQAYTSYGPLAGASAQTPVFVERLLLRAGWQLEQVGFRNISPLIDPMLEVELGLDHPQRVGMYSQALVLDLRDNPIEPRLGAYAELHVDEGTPLAGGALEFVRITPELRGFVPVPRTPIVLAARARAGRFYGEVPVNERYYSGGATTQRGFGERRLAPTVTGELDGEIRSVPVGGVELVETGVELRARLGKVKGLAVGAVAFLDGGDVTAETHEIDLLNLHWAAGLGARVFTPIGALRADVGYRLNRYGPGEPEPGSRFAFHLSIGEAY